MIATTAIEVKEILFIINKLLLLLSNNLKDTIIDSDNNKLWKITDSYHYKNNNNNKNSNQEDSVRVTSGDKNAQRNNSSCTIFSAVDRKKRKI